MQANGIQIAFIFVFLFCLNSCTGQLKKGIMTNESSKQNPLLCAPEKGSCEMPSKEIQDTKTVTLEAAIEKETVEIIYFTDPICSSCWGIEPQLRKLKLEYGQHISIEYRMGGLLPDWNYNSGGISEPADVASHWDEASVRYDMPIDGDVWLEDPLSSSYPPSIAFKAAQLQDEKRAVLFLREIREMLFLQKKNITKWEHLEAAAQKVGLDVVQFETDYNENAEAYFKEDLAVAGSSRVRGFPTFFFMDEEGQRLTVYGAKPYEAYENALLAILPEAKKATYEKSWAAVFSAYPSLTAKEFSVLTEMPRKECASFLDALTTSGKLEKLTTKNGSIWMLNAPEK